MKRGITHTFLIQLRKILNWVISLCNICDQCGSVWHNAAVPEKQKINFFLPELWSGYEHILLEAYLKTKNHTGTHFLAISFWTKIKQNSNSLLKFYYSSKLQRLQYNNCQLYSYAQWCSFPSFFFSDGYFNPQTKKNKFIP
jgi:hypothetical protein